MTNKQKHLELIQGIINRLSTNSSLLKGWSVALVSVLFALATSDCRANLIYFAYIPTTVLWGLDGFFLWQEQLFRKLYDCVRILPEEKIDFSMDVSQITGKERPTWIKATFSKALTPFHGMLILSIFIIEITYSDQEIEELIQERKPLPNDWRNKLLSPNNKKSELFVTGDNGNKFRIIARRNASRPSDFSVILAVLVPLSNRNFRLRRYNGWTNPHNNRIEKEEVDGFHIHFATERYQQIGLNEDTYARPTDRYDDFDGALQCLIDDANFEEPPQQNLF